MGVKLFKEMQVQLMSANVSGHIYAHACAHTHLNANELMSADVSGHIYAHVGTRAHTHTFKR